MKLLLKRLACVMLALVGLACAIAAIEYLGGQPMGLFAGTRPTNLGYDAGKFTPPTWKPNCVSSTVDKSDDKHYIAPIAYTDASRDAWKRLVGIVKGSPRVTLMSENAKYLYVEFKSAGLGFVDDVEFALDEKAGANQMRSASRLGVRDFGANRARIEAIRGLFGR